MSLEGIAFAAIAPPGMLVSLLRCRDVPPCRQLGLSCGHFRIRKFTPWLAAKDRPNPRFFGLREKKHGKAGNLYSLGSQRTGKISVGISPRLTFSHSISKEPR